jgi:hypothetical protein
MIVKSPANFPLKGKLLHICVTVESKQILTNYKILSIKLKKNDKGFNQVASRCPI